jgi:hypothetical protein
MMILCKDLSRESTDKILKIIIREFKELGTYNKAKHNIPGKETFYWYMNIAKGGKVIPSSSVDVFWHLFSRSLSLDGASSYVLIKLLDNKEFADILAHTHDGEFINAQTAAIIEIGINSALANEYEFLVMSSSIVRKLNGLGHERVKELRDIAIKHRLDMRFINAIDRTGI